MNHSMISESVTSVTESCACAVFCIKFLHPLPSHVCSVWPCIACMRLCCTRGPACLRIISMQHFPMPTWACLRQTVSAPSCGGWAWSLWGPLIESCGPNYLLDPLLFLAHVPSSDSAPFVPCATCHFLVLKGTAPPQEEKMRGKSYSSVDFSP